MPRKRKDTDETGINGTRPDTPGEETAAKIVPPAAKRSTRKLSGSAKKAGLKRPKTPRVEPTETLVEGTAALTTPVETIEAESAVVLSTAGVTDAAEKPRLGRSATSSSLPKPAVFENEIRDSQRTPGRLNGPESAAAASESGETVLTPPVSIHEQIALLAYSYWEAGGRRAGNPQEDWFRAEREILSRLRAAKSKRG